MYSFIQGKIVTIENTYAIVNVHGVGYKIFIPQSTAKLLQNHQDEILFHTTFIVREDEQSLYGFVKREQRDLFEILLTVSGVGPKIALGILGHLDVQHILAALAEENSKLLSEVPGIGKKIADRLIVELRGKIKNLKTSFSLFFGVEKKNTHIFDAAQALVNLGFPLIQAQRMIQKVMDEEKREAIEVGELITLALKKNSASLK